MYEYGEAALYPNVNLQIDKNTSMCTEKYFSQRKEEELSQNLLYSAGHQNELGSVLMHGYFSPCETFADREFLSETNKKYAELSVNQTPLQMSAPNDYNNNREKKCVHMESSCYTEVQVNRPTEDIEAIYDDVTGEIKVKLWEHEYPIDPKCSLTPEVCFLDEKAECIFEVCDTKEDMLTENDETLHYGSWKTGKEIRRDIEPVDGSHTSVIPEREADQTAKNPASADSIFKTDIQKTRSYTCMRNKPFIGIDRSSSSLPVIQKHTLNRTSGSMASDHFTLSDKYADLNSSMSEHQWTRCEQPQARNLNTDRCQNEHSNLHSEEQRLQCHSLSYSEEALSDQYNSLKDKGENNSETEAIDITTNAKTRTFLLPNHQYETWIRQSDKTVSNEYIKSTFEHVSNQNTAVSQIVHSKDRGTKSSPGYFYPRRHEAGQTKEYIKNGKLKRGCRLWEYIRNLLLDPCTNPALIRWEDRDEGTFKLVQNKTIAYNWGMKKGNTDMSYEKLSRAMRYYYKKMIFQPVLGKRLVYKFGPRATGWKRVS